MDNNEKLIEILQKYNIKYSNIDKISDVEFLINTESQILIAKMYDNKEKIAWEYKCLLSLQGKVNIPKIYKINDEYISECVMLCKPLGKTIETYEEKKKVSYKLGEFFGNLHIAELNEQRGEEELKKIWKNFILNKALLETTNATNYISQKAYDEVLKYLTENMKLINDDYDISMIIGQIKNEYVYFDEPKNVLTISNLSNVMLGDPAYDFAKVYDFLNFNNEFIQDFVNGYESIISVPDGFEDKLNVYLVLDYLTSLSNLDKEKDKEKINDYIEKIKDIVLKEKR